MARWKWASICPLANMIRKQGKHVLREHVLTGKPTASDASGDEKFCCSIIRVPFCRGKTLYYPNERNSYEP